VTDPRHYRLEVWTICFDLFLWLELYISMFLVLLVGPSLISQDLRFNALPLYFSRPLRRIDYFAGKLGVVTAFVGMVVIVPSVIAYALGLLFSLDLTIIGDTYHLLLSTLAYGLIISFVSGLLMLALSSLSRSSRYTGLFWITLVLVGWITGAILNGVNQDQRRHAFYRQSEAFQAVPPQNQAAQTPEERMKQQKARQEAQQRAWEKFQSEEVRAARSNWTPLVSYTANLLRVGRELLGTNAAWESLSRLQPPGERDRFMLSVAGDQYPWHWSAAVLAGLFGFSACILNFRVRSLDRLR
jgi:ABC-2 type transport system permease protein